MNKLKSEYDFFLSMPRNMRVLLITNIIYACVLPVVDIFVGAYIMRSADDPMLVAIYQLSAYTGIPFTFMINGFLLNKIKIANLYSFGMLMSGVSMIFMMTLGEINPVGVALAGLIMGSSFGFFWANRDFLALNTTNDNNRNYYYGLETFFYTITSIVIPFVIGWFLITSGKWSWIGSINSAYRIVTLIVFLLAILASIIIHSEKYRNPRRTRFIFFKFDKLWRKMLLLSSLKGLAQGYLVTAPAILIMRLVGDEGSLGTIQSLSGILSALMLYVLGRISKPHHRIYIFSVGLVIFFIGTLVNGIAFSATGVIVFVICKVLFMPLHDIAYFPIQLKVIDVLSYKEDRNQYAYIFNHEFGLYVGRFVGLVLFIVLIYYVSETYALKYSLIIIAAIQLLSIPVARSLIKKSNTYKTKPESLIQGEKKLTA
ncbi:MAG: MFS transporter [Bacteroidales bacterium]|nr:MFS transporter [Bacteroidales bacterium]MBN2762815.1 MFS transporter [Bacteroidales bacterium]